MLQKTRGLRWFVCSLTFLPWALSPAPQDLAATAPPIPVWAARSMGAPASPSAALARFHALRFDVITAHVGTYRSHVTAMKSVNPDLRLLAYLNGSFGGRDPSTYPAWWYARDMAGNRIRSTGFGNYLMDISRPAWKERVKAICADAIASSGYDGCYVDMLGTAPLRPGYLTSLPINRATGSVWTPTEWLRVTSNIAWSVKSHVAPRLVFGNGLVRGLEYFDPAAPTEQLLRGIDGASAELWIRLSSDGIASYRSESDWKMDVAMLADVAAQGKTLLTMTKVWVTGTQAQKDAWHEYALASFLLGNGGRSFFTFSYDPGADPTAVHPYWNLDIGTATAPYVKFGGVYQRLFTKGKVLVNPTSVTRWVSLGAQYVNMAGAVVSSVTLGPHSAELLRKV